MSQKLTKRSKKAIEDEITNVEFKTPDNAKTKEETSKTTKTDGDTANGGESNESVKKSNSKEGNLSADVVANISPETPPPKRSMKTRSRSNTPLKKNVETTNGIKDDEGKKEEKSQVQEIKEVKIVEKCEEPNETVPASPANSIEMDPLILDKEEEDAIPELQFDENDVEVESEGSNSRCKTRRSQSRNISTPKTPKTIEPEEIEFLDRSGSVTPKTITSSETQNHALFEIDLNDVSDTQSTVSTSNVSTRAVIGSDTTTNIDLTSQDSGLFEDNSYSNVSSRSYADTVKNLSGRRAIHALGTSFNRSGYVKYVLNKNSLENAGNHYANCESVESISIGMKRKSRSFSPSQSKRTKRESGLLSYFSNLKGSRKQSSSPKLLGIESKYTFDNDEELDKVTLETGAKNEKKWCNVM